MDFYMLAYEFDGYNEKTRGYNPVSCLRVPGDLCVVIDRIQVQEKGIF